MQASEYLLLARSAWDEDQLRIEKRNRAFLEVYNVTHMVSVTLNMHWHQIHFTDNPYIEVFGIHYAISPVCVKALQDWLEALWELYSHSSWAMTSGVFNRNIQPSYARDATEFLIASLELSPDIGHQLLGALRQQKSEQRTAKQTKTHSKSASVEIEALEKLVEQESRKRTERAKAHVATLEHLDKLKAQHLERTRNRVDEPPAQEDRERRQKRRQQMLDRARKVEDLFYGFQSPDEILDNIYAGKEERRINQQLRRKNDRRWVRQLYASHLS